MFTGLVREIGTIDRLGRGGGVTEVRLRAPVLAPELGIGDSLAVNGVCLTVTRRGATEVTVEAAAETLRVTTLSRWRVGDRVHLEPALRLGDSLGGHFVLGHVDGVGRIVENRLAAGGLFLTIALPPELACYLLPKGSIAVDGVSLTVDSGPFSDRFTVNVVPHTLAWTLLGAGGRGQAVNLEMDVLVKAARGEGAAARLRGALGSSPAADSVRSAGGTTEAAPASAPLTMDALRRRGFARRRG
jgi:riboflavin synthase